MFETFAEMLKEGLFLYSVSTSGTACDYRTIRLIEDELRREMH